MIVTEVKETYSCDFCKGPINKVKQSYRIPMGYSMDRVNVITVSLSGEIAYYPDYVHICRNCQVKALEQTLEGIKTLKKL